MSVFPSQSPIREPPLTYDEHDWFERNNLGKPRTEWNVDSSANQHRSKNRGHHGKVGCGGATDSTEHPFIAEVRRVAKQQKEHEISDWVEEPEQEPKENEHTRGSVGRHHEDPIGAAGLSLRGHRGQLGGGGTPAAPLP